VTTAVVAIDEAAARRRQERIRLMASTVREGIDKIGALVDEAKASNDHEALGYASWTAYLADTLGAEPLRLDRNKRREVVALLSGEGMSTRAIAPIVGAGLATVHRDRVATGVPDGTPVRGLAPTPAVIEQVADASLSIARATDDPPPFDPITGELLDDEPEPERTTGLDGKSYPKPAPTKPRRKPLVDALRPKLGRIWLDALDVVAFVNDDRFTANKALLSTRFLGETRAALVALTNFVAALEPQAETEEARNRLVADLDHISETCQRLARTLTEDPK